MPNVIGPRANTFRISHQQGCSQRGLDACLDDKPAEFDQMPRAFAALDLPGTHVMPRLCRLMAVARRAVALERRCCRAEMPEQTVAICRERTPRHRSLEAQGIVLEPQTQIGAPAQRIERDGMEADAGVADSVADRAQVHREIARNNGDRIIADPSIALDAKGRY